MNPVSFERVGAGGDRTALMAQARLLAEHGVRIHSIDEERGLLVRSDEAGRARAVLDTAGGSTDRPAGSDRAGDGTAAAGGGPEGGEAIAVRPLDRPIDATVAIPGSKSHTNRALVCAALAQGRSRLTRVLVADDTEAMMEALTTLGATVTLDRHRGVADVDGGLRAPDQAADDRLAVGVRQSGTTGRFLLPVLAATPGRFLLDGHAQLRARPFGPQVEALRRIGATIDADRLPMSIDGHLLDGADVEVAADVSSQFLSGLLLAAPLFRSRSSLTVRGPMVSRPYVELTTATMAAFGVMVDRADDEGAVTYRVPDVGYTPGEVELEPDASAASYFFAMAAITGGRVRVEGLGSDTVQGDLEFVELLGAMGADVEIDHDATEVRGTGRLRGIDVDLADLSDTAQTLAVVATFADGPTTMRGIGFIRHKEIDRIAGVVNELTRRGIDATETDDGMVVRPGVPTPGRVETHDDHRMAMSFALLGLVHPGIEIADPGCVAKTFPDYFDRLDALRAES